MVCIYCGGRTAVSNSRQNKQGHGVWRRRSCTNCGEVFTTSETAVLAETLQILKNGLYEPFSRDILFISVHDCCRHRKTAQTDATALTDTIISKVLAVKPANAAAISIKELQSVASSVLGQFDDVAATYYQAYFGRHTPAKHE